jgi:hypothetical protein
MHFTPLELAADVFLLFPLLALAFFGEPFKRTMNRLSLLARLGLPVLAAVPYYLVAHSSENFRWSFVGIYAGLPVALVILIWDASRRDPEQRGDWRDFLVLLILGVVVEFKLFERAWPTGRGSFNRLILLDTAVYQCWFPLCSSVLGRENWPAGVGFLYADRHSLGTVVGLFTLARNAPIVCPLCSVVAGYFCCHCGVGGNLFSRITAESTGTPHRAALVVVGDGSHIWSIALQQRRDALQLALCFISHVRGHFLW